MRPLHLAATGLLAAVLVPVLLPATPTYAAGETCQGRPATVVGTPGQVGLVGTEGDDVVVTNGAVSAETLGGADLVCVTDSGFYAGARVGTGAGNDVVDASGTRGRVEAVLGTGSDSYLGSPAQDRVITGRAGTHPTPRPTRWSPPRVAAPPPRATRSSPGPPACPTPTTSG